VLNAADTGFEHLQLLHASDTLISALNTANPNGDWARVDSIDANSFTGQTAHTDYDLKAGDGTAALAHDLTLTTFESHDTISVGDINGHDVDLGRGWDLMNVSGSVTDYSHINASNTSDAHEDMKEINIAGDLTTSTIDTGAGNDHITIGGGISHADIHTYAGDDNVTINGMVIDSRIDLGSGDDYLMIKGSVSGVILYGGENGDIQQAHSSGDTAHLGDILGLSNAAYNSLIDTANHTTTAGNTIQDFNSLLLDMSDNHGDHSLGVLLENFAAFQNATTGDHHDAGALIIQGNSTDSVTGLSQAQADAAQTNVTIEGVSGSFDHYVVDNHDLYIQHEITIKTTT